MTNTDLGIYSSFAGGFIDGPLYTRGEADASLAQFIADGEDPGDVEIVAWLDEDEDEDEDG